jgi:hypothetical protein
MEDMEFCHHPNISNHDFPAILVENLQQMARCGFAILLVHDLQ